MKRIICVLISVMMIASFTAACNNGKVTAEDAMQSAIAENSDQTAEFAEEQEPAKTPDAEENDENDEKLEDAQAAEQTDTALPMENEGDESVKTDTKTQESQNSSAKNDKNNKNDKNDKNSSKSDTTKAPDNKDTNTKAPADTVLVEHKVAHANMSIRVPVDWEYEKVGHDHQQREFGIRFWPKGHEDGVIEIAYYDITHQKVDTEYNRVEDIKLGKHSARKVTWKGDNFWSHIDIMDAAGLYTITNFGASRSGAWPKEDLEKLSDILSTLKVGEGCIQEEEAIKLAMPECRINYTHISAHYEFRPGCWVVSFINDEINDSQDVRIDNNRNVVK